MKNLAIVDQSAENDMMDMLLSENVLDSSEEEEKQDESMEEKLIRKYGKNVVDIAFSITDDVQNVLFKKGFCMDFGPEFTKNKNIVFGLRSLTCGQMNKIRNNAIINGLDVNNQHGMDLFLKACLFSSLTHINGVSFETMEEKEKKQFFSDLSDAVVSRMVALYLDFASALNMIVVHQGDMELVKKR